MEMAWSTKSVARGSTKVARRSPAEPQDLHKLCAESSARIKHSEEIGFQVCVVAAPLLVALEPISRTVIQGIGSCVQILVSKHMSTYMPIRKMQAPVRHKVIYPRWRVLRQ